MQAEFDFIKLLGGLGMFLFGMQLMENSIKNLSSSSLSKIIKSYTSNTLNSFITGLIATIVLQSSSALSLIVLAFVGAGIISLYSAIAVILGANLGSTSTGWLLALFGFDFNIENLALPIIGFSAFMNIFLNQKKSLFKFFSILLGLGLLLLGLSFMKNSMENFSSIIRLDHFNSFGKVIFFLLGIIITAIMHASSATVALALSALNSKIIDFDSAATLVIGADVGSTFTILIGAMGAEAIKRRVAFAHLGFNLVVASITLMLLPLLLWMVSMVFKVESEPLLALVLFHSFFNFIGVIIFIPITLPFGRLLNKLIKDKAHNNTLYINNLSLEFTDTAIISLRKEIQHLFYKVLYHNTSILQLDTKLIFPKLGELMKNKILSDSFVEEQYEHIKLLQAEILTFAVAVQMKGLTKTQLGEIDHLLHGLRMSAHSAKTLKDIKHNFEQFKYVNNKFLNHQYQHFRERLLENYIEILKILENNHSGNNKTELILKLLIKIKKEDKSLLDDTSNAINNKEIEDINLSNLIIANRAFVQSNRQLLLALREIILNEKELKKFDELNQEKDDYLELEDA
jgi:phosphate:Na+ symporter